LYLITRVYSRTYFLSYFIMNCIINQSKPASGWPCNLILWPRSIPRSSYPSHRSISVCLTTFDLSQKSEKRLVCSTKSNINKPKTRGFLYNQVALIHVSMLLISMSLTFKESINRSLQILPAYLQEQNLTP